MYGKYKYQSIQFMVPIIEQKASKSYPRLCKRGLSDGKIIFY